MAFRRLPGMGLPRVIDSGAFEGLEDNLRRPLENAFNAIDQNLRETLGRIQDPVDHEHAAGDVTSGVFDLSRIPTIPASKVEAGAFGAGDFTFLGNLSLAGVAGSHVGITVTSTGASGPAGGLAYLHLEGDVGNQSGEPGGAYLRLTQDGGLIESAIGPVQGAWWPDRDTPVVGVPVNAFVIGHRDNTANPAAPICFVLDNVLQATLNVSGMFEAQGDVIANV